MVDGKRVILEHDFPRRGPRTADVPELLHHRGGRAGAVRPARKRLRVYAINAKVGATARREDGHDRVETMGIEIIAAPTVTNKEPRIKGSIPN